MELRPQNLMKRAVSNIDNRAADIVTATAPARPSIIEITGREASVSQPGKGLFVKAKIPLIIAHRPMVIIVIGTFSRAENEWKGDIDRVFKEYAF